MYPLVDWIIELRRQTYANIERPKDWWQIIREVGG